MGKGGVASWYAGCGPIPVFKKRREGERGGALGHKLHQNFDGLITQAAEKVRFGVNVASRREERLEHALYLYVAHGTKHIRYGSSQRPQGLQQFFALGNGPAIARRYAKDPLTVRQTQ